jgi:hypothetical protein
MSDYRDPPYHDPDYGNMYQANRLRSEAYGSSMLWLWLIGVILVMGVMIYVVGGSDEQTAQFDAVPPANAPAAPATTPPAGPAR